LPKKPIVYSQHARTSIAERLLEERWIEQAVYGPEWIEVDPLDPAIRRHFIGVPERGGRYLRAAVVETAGQWRIVTAFIDRGARPK
jgi:hypothetical protein